MCICLLTYLAGALAGSESVVSATCSSVQAVQCVLRQPVASAETTCFRYHSDRHVVRRAKAVASRSILFLILYFYHTERSAVTSTCTVLATLLGSFLNVMNIEKNVFDF